MSKSSTLIAWEPQPGPQTAAVNCEVVDLLYGGARGGGKTQFLLGDMAIKAGQYGEAFRGLFLRRTLTEMSEIHRYAQDIYRKLEWTWAESKETWTAPNGATVRLTYIEDDKDAERYQGHAYCVEVGTPVLMADGSWKPIEVIKTGDMVETLEGPKPVDATIDPYAAPCIEIRVSVPGVGEVARQVQPVWHHVLSSVEHSGEPSPRDTPTPRRCSEPSGSGLREAEEQAHVSRQEHPGWISWLEATGTCSGACCDLPREKGLPLGWSAPVVLHEPSLRSGPLLPEKDSWVSTGFDGDDKCSPPLSDSTQVMRLKYSGPQRQDELSRSSLDHSTFVAGSSRGVSDARRGASVGGSPVGCRHGHGSGDGRPPLQSGTYGDAPPLRVDAGGQTHAGLRADGTGTIQERIQPGPSSWTHFYTGEVRGLQVDLVRGSISMAYVGLRFVADINVRDVNHYITRGGIINRNTYIAVDEAGNFPSMAPLDKLFGALRSAEGIPVYRRMSANPGGPGHGHIFERYIRHGAWNIRNWQPQPKLAPNVWVSSVFIPAKLEDNKILMENDPMYDARLAMVGDETLYRAWREGDWTVLAGVYFSNFDERNHFDCPEIKPWWPRYLAGDWGFSSWSAFHWGAWDGERLWVYREMSVRGMDPQALGERLVEVNNGDKVERFFFSHDAFSKRTSERSMAQEIADVFIRREASIPMPEPADFNRVAGWQLVFQGFRTKSLIISPTNCMRLMATIPMLVRDPKRPEDVLKGNDDHWADSLRYLCASRLRADVTVPRDILQANFVDEVEDMNVKAMRARLIEAKGDDLAPVRLIGGHRGRGGYR